MTTVAVVLAAGRSRRFGGDRPKQYVDVGGRPVVAHSVAALDQHPGVDAVWVVGAADELDRLRAATADVGDRYLAGGAERIDSVRAAVLETDDGVDRVLVHDAARPLLAPDVVDRVLAALATADAVATVLPVTDTIVEIHDGAMRTPDRSSLFQLQTPQGFRGDVLREAYRRADGRVFTDDVSLVAELVPDAVVTTVEGDRRLHKVTTAADLVAVRAWFEQDQA